MADETEQPNLLFFFPDQHRSDWLGSNPDVPVRTPNVDRLIDCGVQFTNAVCPAPVCAPSRGCLATGMGYTRAPIQGNADDLPMSATTYTQQLRNKSGYHVMGCGKFDLHKGSFSWGVDGTGRLEGWGFSDGVDNAGKWDGILSLAWGDHPKRLDRDDLWERAFETGLSREGEPAEPYTAYLEGEELLIDHIRDYQRRSETNGHGTFPTKLPEEAYIDNWIARRGLSLLADSPKGRPWYLVINFAGPHEPYDVTEEMHDWYRDPEVEFPGPIDNGSGGTNDHQAVRRNYASMIENIDAWLGRYLDVLEERDELDNTVIVFSSDHGEMLGDHDLWGKGDPYQPSTGVPLVIAGPGVESRDPCEKPVTLLDLHDTFLDFAGAKTQRTDSRSLRPLLTGADTEHREYVCSGLGDWRMIFDGRYKFVNHWTPADDVATLDGEECALFDLVQDPNETTNVAEDRPDLSRDLKDALAEM